MVFMALFRQSDVGSSNHHCLSIKNDQINWIAIQMHAINTGEPKIPWSAKDGILAGYITDFPYLCMQPRYGCVGGRPEMSV